MFFTYLASELRHRHRQALVVAFGLALGIGLVMTVSAASAGVKDAQDTVLHSLYGVGTDITVSQAATFGTGGPQRVFGGSGQRPTAGQSFTRDRLRPSPGQATMAESEVTALLHLSGVGAAAGGLSLNDTKVSGTFPAGGFTPGSGSGGASPISVSSFSVLGIAPSNDAVGPLTADEVASGRFFVPADDKRPVAVVAGTYARQQGLKLGSTVDVAGTSTKVVGIASLPGGDPTDVFLPLGEAQKLAGLSGKVTSIYIAVASATDVPAVQSEIHALMPRATVTTSADLAKEVTGSLSTASNLATNLGKWLSVVALLAAFLIAGLLSMAAVSRRVREFGTLKAIGWRTRRVVGQVMGEGLLQGLLGGILGLAIGLVGATLVGALAPTLTATVGLSGFSGGFGPAAGGATGAPGGSFPGGGFGGGGFGTARALARAGQTVTVHLSAPIQGTTVALAVALAIAGGVIAGSFGSWRAARLRPAAALGQVA